MSSHSKQTNGSQRQTGTFSVQEEKNMSKKKPQCCTKQSRYTVGVFSKPKGALTFISACGDFHAEAFLKHYRCF